MTTLDNNTMEQLVGGDKCSLLENLTAGSCIVGFFVACGIGLIGDIAFCW